MSLWPGAGCPDTGPEQKVLEAGARPCFSGPVIAGCHFCHFQEGPPAGLAGPAWPRECDDHPPACLSAEGRSLVRPSLGLERVGTAGSAPGCPRKRRVRVRQGLCQGLSGAHVRPPPLPACCWPGQVAGLGVGGAQGPWAEGFWGGQPTWAALPCVLGEAGAGQGDWLPWSGDRPPASPHLHHDWGSGPPGAGVVMLVGAGPEASQGHTWRSKVQASRSEHARGCLCCFCVCVLCLSRSSVRVCVSSVYVWVCVCSRVSSVCVCVRVSVCLRMSSVCVCVSV